MLLAIDIGNTNIVYGIYEKERLITTFRHETKTKQTYDEYAIKIIEMLKHLGIIKSEINHIIISSVVPQIDLTFETLCIKYFNIKPMMIYPGIKTGLQIKIDNPKQLGADLLVGAVSACTKYSYPCTVIDMGTATTFTVVNRNKEIIGGIILPGVKIAFVNLFEKTAKLEETKLDIPKSLIGKDTQTAIQSGMLYGTCSMIEGLINRIKMEIPEMKFILTGGIGSFIYPYLKEKVIFDENLLLDGLNIIYKKNAL